jgi:hypothetical protein
MSHGSPPVSKLPSSRTHQQLQLHFGIGEPWRVVWLQHTTVATVSLAMLQPHPVISRGGIYSV